MDKQNRKTHTDTGNILVVARLEKDWGDVYKGEEIKMCKFPVIKSQGDVKYSIGTLVNNVAITM